MSRWLIPVVAALVLCLAGCPASRKAGPTTTLPPTALYPSRPPTLPLTCARKGRLVFIGMDRLIGVSVDEVARHFHDTYGLAVEVLPAFPSNLLDPAWDPATRQLRVEQAISTLAAHLGPLGDAWVMALVHLDIRVEKATELGFAFSGRQGPIILLSLARMADAQRDGQMDVTLLRARLFKQLARQIGTTYCGLSRKGPPSSVMREKISTAADLDSIDEADWRAEP